MSLDEFDERWPEISRWERAGAKDGEPAPAGPARPEGHAFTLAEVQGMSIEDFAVNEEAILAQRAQLGQEHATKRRKARETAGRGGSSS